MRKVPTARRRSAPGRAGTGVVAEQVVEEAAGPRARGVGVLRAAIVLRQREQHRAALVVALGVAGAAAAQPLEAGGDLVEIAAHLLDLGIDRAALRRLAGEQREEAGGVAAHAFRLRGDAVEFGLLLGGGFLIAADCSALAASPPAAIDAGQLGFEPRHIGLAGAPCCGGAPGAAGRLVCDERRAVPNEADAKQRGAGKISERRARASVRGISGRLRANPRGLIAERRGLAAMFGQGRLP